MCSDRRNGFTLLEVVCTLIILGVLGSLVFSGFGSALTGYAQMRETGPVYMQAELALVRLQRELAGATYDIKSDGNIFSFQKADGTNVRLSLSGGALRLALNPGSGNATTGDPILLDGVSVPQNMTSFISTQSSSSGDAPELITVTFSLKTPVGAQTYSLSVSPRNTPPTGGSS